MTRAALPHPSARAEMAPRGASLMELCIVGVMSLLSVELETTITQTQRLTQPYQTTMTTSPPSAGQSTASLQPSSFQLFPPPGAGLRSFFLMFPGDQQLDALFEDHGVLVLSLRTFLHLSGQSVGGAFQRNLLFRQTGGSTGENGPTCCKTSSPPPLSRPAVHTFLFSSWILLTGSLKGKTTTFTSSTSSPLAAAAYIFTRMGPARAQVPRHARPLADLPATIERVLARRPDPERTVVAHRVDKSANYSEEYRILEVRNYELTTPTPAAWIEVFERRLSLWQELQLQQPYHPRVPRAPLANSVHLLAEANIRDHPFTANSRPKQVGASVWFISVAF